MRRLVAAGILILALAGCGAAHTSTRGAQAHPAAILNTYRTIGGNCYDNGQLAFYGACFTLVTP